MVDVSARVKADTGSDSLAIIAAAGQVMNTQVWQPTGEVMAPVIGAARYIAGVREGIDGVAAGVAWVEGKVC